MNNKHVIIIAEAGVNHNGEYDLAQKLVDVGVKAGVDYIKFQISTGAHMVTSKFAKMADYQKKNTNKDESQLDFLKNLNLSFEEFGKLKDYANQQGGKLLCTPFDIPSIDLLNSYGLDYMKVPSGEITNLPYLRKIAELNIPIIISTGMCSLGDIESALEVLTKNGLKEDKISLLHCNTEYPTPFEDVNLRAMLTLKQCFGVKVGYSDHTKGIEVPIAAVALGAEIIEKHYTLDRDLPGPDHKASLEPNELTSMVQAIRNIELAIGVDIKRVSSSEKKNVDIARRSIIAAKDIKAGEVFTEENLTTKRPGNGISPMRWEEVIGKKAKRDFIEDELIEL